MNKKRLEEVFAKVGFSLTLIAFCFVLAFVFACAAAVLVAACFYCPIMLLLLVPLYCALLGSGFLMASLLCDDDDW